MIIEIEKLTSQNTRIAKELRITEGQEQFSDSVVLNKVQVDVLLQGKPGEKFTLKGEFNANLTCTCVKCLKEFELDLDREVDLQFMPLAKMDSDLELQLEEEDLNVSAYEDTIDLIQIVEEQVMLAMPMRVICSEDCAGLCSGCGKESEQCTCEPDTDTVDERLLVLKDIKARMLQKMKK